MYTSCATRDPRIRVLEMTEERGAQRVHRRFTPARHWISSGGAVSRRRQRGRQRKGTSALIDRRRRGGLRGRWTAKERLGQAGRAPIALDGELFSAELVDARSSLLELLSNFGVSANDHHAPRPYGEYVASLPRELVFVDRKARDASRLEELEKRDGRERLVEDGEDAVDR